MSRYKLSFFNIRGLGEPIRLMFKFAGVNLMIIESNILNGLKLNHVTTPTGKVPILYVNDDKILVESGAIYRYLGSKFNLRPKCDWDNAQMESAVDYYNDFRDEIRPFFRIAAGLTKEGEEEDKQKLYNEIFLPSSNRVFNRYNQILECSKSEFLADSGFSWGDFVLAEKVLTMRNLDSHFEERFPKIVDYQKRVHSINEIADYVKERKFKHLH